MFVLTSYFLSPYNKITVGEGLWGRQCLEGISGSVGGGGIGGAGAGNGRTVAGLAEGGGLGGSIPFAGLRFCWHIILKK